MKKNICFLIFFSIGLTFLTSCWDVTEIEEVGFLMAVGLDPVQQEEEEMEEYEREVGRNIGRNKGHDQMFNATYNVAIPSKMGRQDGVGAGGRSYFNITSTGLTNFNTIRQIGARRSRRLNFEHLKAIIINEQLVRGGPMLEHLTDIYIRDHEMRRRANVYITNSDTKEILEMKLPLEQLIAKSIRDINENHEAVVTMLRPTTIGEVSTNITEGHSFLIPRIVPRKDDLIISGAAIFLGYENKMLGWLGEDDMKGYNLVCGEADNAIFEVEYEEEESEFFVFEVITMDTAVAYERVQDKDIFHLEIGAEGAFTESWLHGVEISDVSELRKLEEQVEEELTRNVNKILDKMQNEFYADIFGFHKKVRQKQYQYWKTVKDHWDGEEGVFQHADIQVNTKVRIRHYMLNERLE